MKKILLLALLSTIVLSGCGSKNINARLDSIEQRISALENAKTTSSEKQSQTNVSNTSTELNVFSFELSSTDPTATSDSVKHTYKVTNNGSVPIEYITIKVAYYDADGNCLDTDGRFNDVVIEPEKSVFIDSYGGKKDNKNSIASSKITSYTYYLVSPNENGNSKIEVNCETGKTKESPNT